MDGLIIGERYRALLERPLQTYGFHVLWMPDNSAVDGRLAGHADLSAIYLGGRKIVLSPNVNWSADTVNYLINSIGAINYAADLQGTRYPYDATLCACVLGDKLLHNSAITDSAVKAQFSGAFISVKQGYTNCSVCAVNDHAVITSDAGIAGALCSIGLHVLLISPGAIELSGYNCGFIGGASFATESNVFFTGTLDAHPDKAKIERFISELGKTPVYLTPYPAFDIGGAVVIPARA